LKRRQHEQTEQSNLELCLGERLAPTQETFQGDGGDAESIEFRVAAGEEISQSEFVAVVWRGVGLFFFSEGERKEGQKRVHF